MWKGEVVFSLAPGAVFFGEFENKNYGKISVSDVIVNSSNRGTGRMALQIGAERQQAFLASLGLMKPVPLELSEAPTGRPLFPTKWTDLSTVTISYGHGISTSPVHLAAGYAAIANGGLKVTPTLLRHDVMPERTRVMSQATAAAARDMLRKVVTEGTASLGEVTGYAVAGKTGTADKFDYKNKVYYDDKVLATFASFFPADNPRYVLVVTLDEPEETSANEVRRTAGWTAVPVAAEIIRRVAPLLGLRPVIEPGQRAGIRLISN